ncbi:hypothetical protein B7492_32560 (plasmid) [Bacillus mycoides]|uniref:Uncharacterized protein n=1 Tax=Bacillus mycoides TaxID=1405 RepID=A0A1W6AIW8_BACMY|nr:MULTISPECIES: hypothetical protein [Bacillus]ARJ25770.1 hypothetical protein B7492_32560 [Bacillus mycoides]MBK5491308.1 hypothetical protein [Bacillus sp. TH17]
MKKKAITLALSAMLGIGALVPIAASAAESFDTGFDQNKMEHFAIYYNSVFTHASGITKNGHAYKSTVAPAGYKAALHLSYTGPYAVTYQKYVY